MFRRRSFARLVVVALVATIAEAVAAPPAIPTRLNARIGGFGQAFTVEWKGDTLTYTESTGFVGKAKTATLTPTPAQWQEFRAALDKLDVWSWKAKYPTPGTADGTQWSLDLAYTDRTVKAAGDNNYPDAAGKPTGQSTPSAPFREFLAAVQKLAGGREFR